MKIFRYLRLIFPALALIGIFLYLLLTSTAFIDISGIVAIALVAVTLIYFIVSMNKNR
ncbi:MAG: hypothetical protein AB1767_11090 [Bacillota bacterium]